MEFVGIVLFVIIVAAIYVRKVKNRKPREQGPVVPPPDYDERDPNAHLDVRKRGGGDE